MAVVTGVRVETVPSPVRAGATWETIRAETIEIEGVPHRVGDLVKVLDWRGRWDLCPITAIYRSGPRSSWKVAVRTGNGETARRPGELQAGVVRALPRAELIDRLHDLASSASPALSAEGLGDRVSPGPSADRGSHGTGPLAPTPETSFGGA